MINLIPLPKKYEMSKGFIELTSNVKIKSEIDLPLVETVQDDAQIIIKKDSSLSDEAYTLDIGNDKVNISASGSIGAYYALQSLRQLSRAELGRVKTPCCTIKDEPRFKWRGLMLDESRHFFGKELVKKFLDIMFMMKLNVFHWHLSDDQGWRIEIKKYPLLTEIGATREYTQINGWGSTQMINERHEGFYTQEEIKEIVAYAADRGIMIVPELDVPAHSAAAIAAYPWLACRELKREVPGYFGGGIPKRKFGIKDWNRPICPGKDKTVEFVKDIVDEVCEIFPAPYYHIGGDEAPKDEWKTCPDCQKKIKELGLKNEEDLQGWFNNIMLDYLKAKGKSLIGWNDILKAGNLDDSIVIQYWTPQRDKKAEEFVNGGGKMILSNHQSFYFDMTYSQYPLRNTYDYTPEKFKVNSENIKNVLGVEGENWTEWTPNRERLEFQIFPRLQALAEVAWSPEQKNWDDFKARLDEFKPYFEKLDINYAVDKLSLSKNPITRMRAMAKFHRGDTNYEVNLNKKYKARGDK